jgi:alginate O-acetyltransferase complex protein AlgI
LQQIDKKLPSLKESGMMLLTFGLTVFAWIFFRAENLSHAFSYIGGMFSDAGSYLMFEVYARYRSLLVVIAIMLSIEWFGRKGAYGISGIDVIKSRLLRWSFYLLLGLQIFMYHGKQQEFIYFQF